MMPPKRTAVVCSSRSGYWGKKRYSSNRLRSIHANTSCKQTEGSGGEVNRRSARGQPEVNWRRVATHIEVSRHRQQRFSRARTIIIDGSWSYDNAITENDNDSFEFFLLF